jgi:hypothetical protein
LIFIKPFRRDSFATLAESGTEGLHNALFRIFVWRKRGRLFLVKATYAFCPNGVEFRNAVRARLLMNEFRFVVVQSGNAKRRERFYAIRAGQQRNDEE